MRVATISQVLALACCAVGQGDQETQRNVEIATSLLGASHDLRSDLFGYSIEPSSLYAYVSSPIARRLFQVVNNIVGHPPSLRIGGTTADEITIEPTVNTPSGYSSTDPGSSEGNNGPATIKASPKWYSTWANYFDPDTEFTYALNFANITAGWQNAIEEFKLVSQSLHKQLKRLEFGNEVDHFKGKHWRPNNWGVVEFAKEWRELRSMIQKLPEYTALDPKPKFQAASFATIPRAPAEIEKLDEFNVPSLVTKAGLTNSDGSIADYSVHLYPQGKCRWDKGSIQHLSLSALSNHAILHNLVSLYVESQTAARDAGAPLIWGETNSVACGGRSGISDTFGAALWTIDHALLGASYGIEQIYFHMGAQSEYSAFVPLPYNLEGEALKAGVRANFYGHLFVAEVVAGGPSKIAAIPGANSSDFSGYAIFGEGKEVTKLVFLDMGVWNSSEGISNPSTLHQYDSLYKTPGQRPKSTLRIKTTWSEGTTLTAIRLQAPGTNAKSLVTIAGQTIDVEGSNGSALKGIRNTEAVTVGANGVLEVQQERAEALLLQRPLKVTSGQA